MLFFLKNPAIAGQLRHLEVHGGWTVEIDRDLDFIIPPKEPRQLGLEDLERLKTTIKKAGFTEGNEPQMLLHILLQNLSGQSMYVIHS